MTGTAALPHLDEHRSLRTRNEFLDALLHSLDVGIVACDAQGHLTEFNPTTRRWHGLDADSELEPERFAEHFSLFEADGTTPLTVERIPLLRALKEGQVSGAEMVIAPHGGAPTRVVAQGRAMVNDSRTTCVFAPSTTS